MKRRDFLKASLGGTAALVSGGTAQARPNLEPAAEAVGMLYDSTLCVGCKACVSSCKKINGMPPETAAGQDSWDAALDLSDKTLNVIKVYQDGKAEVKDAAVNGFALGGGC